MDRIPFEPGRVALATAGRDEGRLFVVTEVVDDDYCLISDGDTRKTIHPKLKKKKHLRAKPMEMEIPSGAKLTNADIRKFLTGSSKKEG